MVCEVKKIDSNVSGLRYAVEECLGLLPTAPAPTWTALEPNSYSDFGATIQTQSRRPISAGRQQEKGLVVGVDAAGGFNQDLTQTNSQELLSGFMFNDIASKSSYLLTGAADELEVDVTGTFPQIVSTAIDFVAAGIVAGETIYVGGDSAGSAFVNAENNGFKRVRAVSQYALTIDKSDMEMVAETTSGGKTIEIYLGRTLKNGTKRKTFQLERTLGSLSSATPQAEYLVGAVPSELKLNLATRDKLTGDFSFVAVGHETTTSAQGLKAGTRPSLPRTDAFNTSSDIHRIRLAKAGDASEAPAPLFAFATDLSLTINNTLSPAYAIGKISAFEVTAGIFTLTGNMEAYFSDVEAISAVRNNEDITLDIILVKNGAGIAIDMPLISLSGGQVKLELDQPIKIPLNTEGATGAKIDAALDHTLMFTFFDTLPASAQ